MQLILSSSLSSISSYSEVLLQLYNNLKIILQYFHIKLFKLILEGE